MKGWIAGVLMVIVAPLVMGCAGTAPTAKTTGKVTVAGSPVEGITVSLMPVKGKPATGKTDASGNFTLTTFKQDDGAMLGKHKVSFNVATLHTTSSGPPAPGSDYMKMDKSKQGPSVPFNAKYTNPDTSGIEVEIKSGTNTLPPWDLQK